MIVKFIMHFFKSPASFVQKRQIFQKIIAQGDS